jgi:hypothetical protein
MVKSFLLTTLTWTALASLPANAMIDENNNEASRASSRPLTLSGKEAKEIANAIVAHYPLVGNPSENPLNNLSEYFTGSVTLNPSWDFTNDSYYNNLVQNLAKAVNAGNNHPKEFIIPLKQDSFKLVLQHGTKDELKDFSLRSLDTVEYTGFFEEATGGTVFNINWYYQGSNFPSLINFRLTKEKADPMW